jgi:hypothetical protein
MKLLWEFRWHSRRAVCKRSFINCPAAVESLLSDLLRCEAEDMEFRCEARGSSEAGETGDGGATSSIAAGSAS